MAPFNRFQASPYKNALPKPSPPTSHYFPHLSSQPTAVAASEDAIFVVSGSEITVLGWEDQGKVSVKERRSWNPAVGEIKELRVQGGVGLFVSGKTSVRPPAPPSISLARLRAALTCVSLCFARRSSTSFLVRPRCPPKCFCRYLPVPYLLTRRPPPSSSSTSRSTHWTSTSQPSSSNRGRRRVFGRRAGAGMGSSSVVLARTGQSACGVRGRERASLV